VRVRDGRAALLREDRRFDVIEVDALYPWRAGSGMLYSQEFYELCARRLKPRGVLCVWGPTQRAQDTFRRVFPRILIIPDLKILVGSGQPLERETEVWVQRLRSERLRQYLHPVDPEQAVRFLEDVVMVGHKRAYRLLSPNRDLLPWDEFSFRY